MATPSRGAPNPNQKNPSATTTICSSFLRTVFLHDWWLIKAEMDSKGRILGIGGFASREKQGIRVFHSAAIAKRHDSVTLETADGITITISGFINKPLTHQNGFSYEVCNHFRFGFPYRWEDYAAGCFGEESMSGAVPSRISILDGLNRSANDGRSNCLPLSLDDLPVTRIRDLFMSTLGDEGFGLTKSIFDVILQKYGGSSFKQSGFSVHSNKEIDSRGVTEVSELDKTPSSYKRNKFKQKCKHGNGISNALSKGVTTRSMTRLKILGNKQEETLSSNTSVKCGLSELFSVSEASEKQCGGIGIRRNASNVSHATVISEREMEVRDTPDKSALRRSSRLKNLRDPFSTLEASRHQCGEMETTTNALTVCHINQLSREEMEVDETPSKSATRRNSRLKNRKK